MRSTNAKTTVHPPETPLVRVPSDSDGEYEHFVRALSHDMRANFMLLESSFARLKRALGELSRPDLRGMALHVEACLDQSRRFLDDLVSLARTGTIEMEPETVDAGAAVDEVLFEQREMLDARRVEIDVRRPLPAVWCNRQRLKQVLTNLIRNAAKHGCDPHGPRITISGQTIADGPGVERAWIRIHDNGPGMDPRFHEEVFLPGRRLPTAAEGGSGMGLAIVRKIVEHYGGLVRVDPDCREGTAIIFTLPTPMGGTRPPGLPEGAIRVDAEGSRYSQRDTPHPDRPLHRHRTPAWPRAGCRRG